MRKIITRICNFIFGKHKNNTLPRYWILTVDMVIVVLAYVVAILMLYFRDISASTFDWSRIWLVPVIYFLAFLISKTYDGMLRYSGFNDIIKIFYACTGALSFLIISKLVIRQFSPQLATDLYPRYVTLIYHYLITMVVMIIMRFSIRRLYNEVYKNVADKMNTIIYGAGDGGTMLMRTLSQDTNSKFRIKAFVDDNPKRVGTQINTIKIYSPKVAMTPEFIEKFDIDVMIVAIPSLSQERNKEIIEQGLALNLIVKSIPAFDKWVDGKLSTSQIQDIKIEDLLGRKPIILGKSNVIREINEKVVLVTGAAGSIGSEICRQVMHYNPTKLVMLDQAESPLYDFQFEMNNTPDFANMKDRMAFVITNVKDPVRMREVFELYHPQVVFHAAAYKHVPFMEENAYEAVFVNVFGTKLVADLAIEYGVEKFVMISTDKAVNPTNVMGATKRCCEMIVQYMSQKGTSTEFVTTRFGNVLGSNGSVIPLFRRQIEAGKPVTVTHPDIIRYFMTIPEAVSLVLEAGAIAKGGEIFVLDMGDPVKITTLAENLIRMYGKVPYKDVEIKFTGLRPGEKLFEELLMDEEGLQKTDNKKIFIGNQIDINPDKLYTQLRELHNIAMSNNNDRTVEMLAEMVDTFHHKTND